MAIKCTFMESARCGRKSYSCFIDKQEIPDTDTDIILYGNHTNRKTNEDVEIVRFYLCTMSKVPSGLMKLFPNMKVLSIRHSQLRSLKRVDMAQYKDLEEFACEGNFLFYFIPGYLFHDFKSLKRLSFYNEQLKLVEPFVLNGLDSLEVADFRGANSSSYQFLYSKNQQGSLTLEQAKQKLRELFDSHKDLYPEFALTQEVTKIATDNDLTFDIKNFLKTDENFKDFKIDIDGREYPLHKFLLAARSPTLAEMLRNNPEAENLKLVDIPVEVFEVILKFLYTDELPNPFQVNCSHLFAVASRLKIEKLKDYAVARACEQVNAENAIEALTYSNKFGHDGLRQKAFAEIKKKYPKIEFDDKWATDDGKVVKIIEFFRKKEEEIRKMEEEFKEFVMKS